MSLCKRNVVYSVHFSGIDEEADKELLVSLLLRRRQASMHKRTRISHKARLMHNRDPSRRAAVPQSRRGR